MRTKKFVKRIKLYGYTAEGRVANTHQAKKVVGFVASDGRCKIRAIGMQPSHRRRDGSIKAYSTEPPEPKLLEVTVTDSNVGVAILSKHKSHKFYEGEIGDQKVNVELKRISGELRYIDYVHVPLHVVEGLIAKGYYGHGYSR